jgi:dihydroxy-acid dehydratase
MANTRTYRSNFQPGTTRWAVRRAQWRALGLTDADMLKPKIAIVNSSSDLSICFSHLDTVVSFVRSGIKEAGGLPFEIRTVAPSDFITSAGRGGRYLMPSRDLMVNDIEVAVEGAVLDGMVCISSCDKTTPAHLMAAARLNIPSIIVIGGYQACGRLYNKPVDIDDVFESVGGLATGAITARDIEQMCEVAICSPGVCAGMGTANTMHIMAEALGMTLPSSAPISATSQQMFDLAHEAGRRIVELVNEDLRPRRIMAPAAFGNAVAVGLAVSGSINMLRHLQAVASEGEIDVDVYRLLDELGQKVPLLCAIKPNGDGRIDELDRAGGARAVMKQLETLLSREALTVNGRTVGENIAGAVVDGTVIGSLDHPVRPGPSIVILKGSLAPVGAIMKRGTGGYVTFRGPCRVFTSQEDALVALAHSEIKGGEVVVLRGLGARGGPGVASASWFVAAVNGAHLGDAIAVVTDGQLSGLNRGFSIGQVLPEAADGGPIAIVKDNDVVSIDVTEGRIDIEIPETELNERIEALPAFRNTENWGWLAIYQTLVQPLTEGGTLIPVPHRASSGGKGIKDTLSKW